MRQLTFQGARLRSFAGVCETARDLLLDETGEILETFQERCVDDGRVFGDAQQRRAKRDEIPCQVAAIDGRDVARGSSVRVSYQL
jgi:hypothetical protein